VRFTKELLKLPHHCIYFPQIGSGHDQGFIVPNGDFDAWDSRLQPAVSVVALQQIAEQIPEAGLAKRDDLTLALAENENLKRELEDLKTQLAEADKFADAAEWTLNHFNTQVKQKPGRKPAAKAASTSSKPASQSPTN
jgi:hypothetical protein